MVAFVVELEDAEAQFPEYEFVQRLTPSAQKAAFHVRDKDGNDLCLKLIAPNYVRDRLDREVSALQSINHPSIVKLKEYVDSSSEDAHRHFIIEEFIDGCDLTDLIQVGNPWELGKASQLFASISCGLGALADQKIVHRDLKPSNVRVRPNGSPVIIDFGLSRHLNEPDITLTAQGARIGTKKYFSPEQINGTKYDIDHRTDLFAFGVMLHEAVTGSHPFWDETDGENDLFEKICESEAHLDGDVFKALPRGWQLLLQKLMHKHRAKRVQMACQVQHILKKLGGQT